VEHEREAISSRTMAALAVAKTRGVVLGYLATAKANAAAERVAALAPLVAELQGQGLSLLSRRPQRPFDLAVAA
jgi:DNA invertase Pin-like site-specific DNA recombinase